LAGNELREQLAELAKLDQTGVRIIMEIAFGKGPAARAERRALSEAKIAGLDFHGR